MFSIATEFGPPVSDWLLSQNRHTIGRPCLASSFIPFSHRAQLLAEFSEVVAECSTEGWNGGKSDPIKPAAFAAAQKLIDHMPAGLNNPTVGALAEGLLVFEWYKGQKQVVMVVPNHCNGIDYAIRRGNEVIHGSAPFFGPMPNTVLSAINSMV